MCVVSTSLFGGGVWPLKFHFQYFLLFSFSLFLFASIIISFVLFIIVVFVSGVGCFQWIDFGFWGFFIL